MPGTDAIEHERIAAALPAGDALLVVPPFFVASGACLAAHVLQACARATGRQVGVFYANLLFAAEIGEDTYHELTHSPGRLSTRQIFAPAAFGTPAVDYSNRQHVLRAVIEEVSCASEENAPRVAAAVLRMSKSQSRLDSQALAGIREKACRWADQTARAIASRRYRVVGCTSMFSEQIMPCIAVLRRVKQFDSSIVAALGGNCCDAEMAEGIASIGAPIDAIFSGESETTFPEFLRDVLDGAAPSNPIRVGEICRDLDALPPPTYEDFFEQRRRFLPASGITDDMLQVPYETSRGCWWGEKRKCTFCGINPQRVRFRRRSQQKILADLKAITVHHPTRRIRMTDSAMPKSYVPELMLRLREEVPGLKIHYEVRPDLSLRDILAMRHAGVIEIQTGIESLSSHQLKLMGRGVSLRTNLSLLRYTRAVNLHTIWNLLWGVPSDRESDYAETLDLIPLLYHLEPPSNFVQLTICRFSPYYENAERYGIRDVRPAGELARSLPATADMRRISRRFAAHFDSGAFANPDLIVQLHEATQRWRSYWHSDTVRAFGRVPRLAVLQESADQFRLLDTRGLPGTEPETRIDRGQAGAALVNGPLRDAAEVTWALGAMAAVARDGHRVALATAAPELMLEFEALARQPAPR